MVRVDKLTSVIQLAELEFGEGCHVLAPATFLRLYLFTPLFMIVWARVY